MNKLEAVDVDTPEDLAVTEAIAALHLIYRDAAK